MHGRSRRRSEQSPPKATHGHGDGIQTNVVLPAYYQARVVRERSHSDSEALLQVRGASPCKDNPGS